MKRLRQIRGLLLSFTSGLTLGNTETGIKLCIVVPLVILLFMMYDEKKASRNNPTSGYLK